ncbi:TetR/AcrR family transcriptional regulator [Novosphingobium sp. Rr 2-17]|uniref:TetR/AcrR family transcriptional regulator n=1 Tax=Novosphingobium sp. Rr 2-17 TaxID=555793 RepID=UPI00178C2669|nr:TetR family transcriptional regulator [Novosphingobium sp. Rr 2-17]
MCASTNIQVSSLYHHFGSLEQLLVSAQEHAIDAAEAWCTRQIGLLADDAMPPAALGALLAGLIDDWCHDERRLAFAWRECHLNAVKQATFIPLAGRWTKLWSGFWAELCERLGIAGHAITTARFFAGESGFHLVPWNRQIDRAALGETCTGWSAWLCGQVSPPSPWRDRARALAGAGLVLPPLRDDVAERIAATAGAIVERSGVAGLTYRAVAVDAGLTLGVVSHKFRTGADLLAAAFDALYRRAATRTADELADLPAMQPEAVSHELAEMVVGEFAGSLGLDELLLACARNPALRPFGGHLRYLRGRTSGHYLAALLGPAKPTHHIDAAIFSSFLIGVTGVYCFVQDREERIAGAEAEIARVIAALTGG